MLTALVVIIHVLVALSLIMIILLQTGKGAGMGAAFGGSSSTVFGSTGRASFLTKVTIIAAVVFTLTSMGLSMMQGGPSGIMEDYQAPATTVPTMPQMPPVTVPDGAAPGAAIPMTPEPGAEGEAGGAIVPGMPGEEPTAAPEAAPAAPGGEAAPESPAPAPIVPPPAAAPSVPPPQPGTPTPAPGQ